jgi:hypothetical protein
MTVLLLTALLALWALGAIVAVSLCVVAGRSDRTDLAQTRGATVLRLVSSR